MIHVFVPIRIISAANAREHYRTRAARVKSERNAVTLCLSATPELRAAIRECVPPLTITLTRIAPRPIRDEDNLQSGCKGPRDAVAGVLGLDDGDPRLTWRYRQEVGPYALRVEIARPAPAGRARRLPADGEAGSQHAPLRDVPGDCGGAV